MRKNMQKTTLIVLASVGAAAALGALAFSVWNNKKFRTMRLVHRTNMILNRIGNALCKLSEAGESCMCSV